MKFVVLPFGYYSRIFREEKVEIIITTDSYEGVLETVKENVNF